jgi:dihydrolipoamide dehydrogenase
MATEYDIIIIGAGPGGYVAAERAGARGKKTLLIEKSHLGGVCLNEGCIPTKTLLNSAKHYAHAIHSGDIGVHVKDASFNLAQAMAWKAKVIDTNRKGIAFLMKKYKVDVVSGHGVFKSRNVVAVGEQEYTARSIIVATGSSPLLPPIPGADGPKVVSSTELLAIEKLPEKLVVVGGGVIGLEFASFFSMLDVEVHVVEMLDEVVPFMEPDLAKNLRRAMKAVSFHLGAKVSSIDADGTVHFEEKGKNEQLSSDLVLMAVGRKPNIDGLGLKEAGIRTGRQGILVNDMLQATAPGVWAIGDVIGKSLFAHSASRMGEVVVDRICGGVDDLDWDAIPWAVYTWPEAAACGKTEAQAKEAGYEVLTSSLQMRVNARYLAENGNLPGMVKVVADKKSGSILGIHLLGGACSEMIHSAALMMSGGLKVKDICRTVFPHPSVSEVIREAVMALGE